MLDSIRARLRMAPIRDEVGRLESIHDRLELIPEAPGVRLSAAAAPQAQASPNKDVSILHGRDNEAKQEVARFIAQIGFRPVILHEQPNRGMTIIEKLEANSDTAVAVVLLTGTTWAP